MRKSSAGNFFAIRMRKLSTESLTKNYWNSQAKQEPSIVWTAQFWSTGIFSMNTWSSSMSPALWANRRTNNERAPLDVLPYAGRQRPWDGVAWFYYLLQNRKNGPCPPWFIWELYEAYEKSKWKYCGELRIDWPQLWIEINFWSAKLPIKPHNCLPLLTKAAEIQGLCATLYFFPQVLILWFCKVGHHLGTKKS